MKLRSPFLLIPLIAAVYVALASRWEALTFTVIGLALIGGVHLVRKAADEQPPE